VAEIQLPALPGSVTRQEADSQQAHPIDLFADKLFILVHQLARLLSVAKWSEVYHEEDEESIIKLRVLAQSSRVPFLQS
jgi:hypothetical protein